MVLFFHANWCPTCIAINKDIDSNIGTLPKDITILKVNYDDAQDLKTLYSITEQHTFAQVDNTGKLIKKWR
ncbi:thioredoxin family protein [Candidatus Peribacteria bacterium]|nr:thioredoxin family protein [Candidatus Peribacteria bacterium]